MDLKNRRILGVLDQMRREDKLVSDL